jgi:DNA mismatch endonuclease (patch repair protein)
MSTLKRRDNDAELALRRALHAAGYRYRVTYPVPGLPRRSIDVAFTRAKVAVFVDGCFWHGCPEHGTSPRANSAWWRAKIEANRARDRDTSARLAEQGWRVMRVWEHDPIDEKLVAIQSVLESLGTTHCCDGIGDHRRH